MLLEGTMDLIIIIYYYFAILYHQICYSRYNIVRNCLLLRIQTDKCLSW